MNTASLILNVIASTIAIHQNVGWNSCNCKDVHTMTLSNTALDSSVLNINKGTYNPNGCESWSDINYRWNDIKFSCLVMERNTLVFYLLQFYVLNFLFIAINTLITKHASLTGTIAVWNWSHSDSAFLILYPTNLGYNAKDIWTLLGIFQSREVILPWQILSVHV